MEERSEYWQNNGVTEKREGRIYSVNSYYLNERGIYFMCDECCNGDRCDDPNHRNRESCHACLGTGINLTAERLNKIKHRWFYGIETLSANDQIQLLNAWSEYENNFIRPQYPDYPKPINTRRLMMELVSQIEPQKIYPVTYTVNQKGEKEYGSKLLKGEDLTENQIYELWQNGYLKTTVSKI